MEPAPGIEPGTSALRKHCSTAELSWHWHPPKLGIVPSEGGWSGQGESNPRLMLGKHS